MFDLEELPTDVREKIERIEFFDEDDIRQRCDAKNYQGEVTLKPDYMFCLNSSQKICFMCQSDLIDLVLNYVEKAE